MDFVFEWCTDFREDDYKMKGTAKFESTARRKILEKDAERVIWIISYRAGGRRVEGVRAVWLRPPNSWHLEACGDHREVGEYKLSSLSRNRTRLDMVFRITYDGPRDVVSRAEWAKSPRKNWDAFAEYLQRDYEASRAERAAAGMARRR